MEEYKKPAGSGFATASLVFGIAALVSTFLFPVLLPFSSGDFPSFWESCPGELTGSIPIMHWAA